MEPTAENGSAVLRKLMIDKITTVTRSKLGERIGSLGDANLVRVNRVLVVFLGIAGGGGGSGGGGY